MGCFQTDKKNRNFHSGFFIFHPNRSGSLSLTVLSNYSVSVITTLVLLQTLNLLGYNVTSEPNPIMIPPASGREAAVAGPVYSLFPNEDLRTGKKIRFEDDRLDRDRSFRSGDRYRTYPIMFDDRVHRPGDYTDRSYLDSLRNRGSRVYFDDDKHQYQTSSYDRYPPPLGQTSYPYNNHNRRPTLLQRPISPIRAHHQYHQSSESYPPQRPYHHHYLPEVSPGPSLSKLPVGATTGRGYDHDAPLRIHVFNPESNSFGNPRNSGGGKFSPPGLTGNFIETGAPGPDLFINHDEYLEYHRKIALAREEEFRRLQNNKPNLPDTKKVLFASKQPFDIAGLSPPNKGIPEEEGILLSKPVLETELAGGGGGGKGHISVFTGSDGQVALAGVVEQHQRPRNQEPPNNNKNNNANEGILSGGNNAGGGNGNIVIPLSDNGDVEVESENAKSQVTQIPPYNNHSANSRQQNFISKSGRQLAYQQVQPHHSKSLTSTTLRTTPTVVSGSSSGNKGDGGGGSTVSLNSAKLAKILGDTPATTKTSSNNNANKETDGTDFLLSSSRNPNNNGGGQALPLVHVQHVVSSNNANNQNNNNAGFLPNVPIFQIPADAEKPRAMKLTSTTSPTANAGGSKGEKSELGTEVTKSRIKSNTAAKVAIIKHQELKQRQKEKSAAAFIKAHANAAAKLNNNYNSANDFNLNFNPADAANNEKKAALERQRKIYDQLTKTTKTKPTSSTGFADIPRTDTLPSSFNPNSRANFNFNKKLPLGLRHSSPLGQDPFLNNNDIINPQQIQDNNNNFNNNNNIQEYPSGLEDDGHFSLINLNNDQVDIIHDVENNNPSINNIGGDEIDKSIGSVVRLRPPVSVSSISELNPEDALLFLGSNDDLVNKTLHAEKRSGQPMNNAAASTNFIKVIRVKNSHAPANTKTTFAAANLPINTAVAKNYSQSSANNIPNTAEKTLSVFMAKRMDKHKDKKAAGLISAQVASITKSMISELRNFNGTFDKLNKTFVAQIMAARAALEQSIKVKQAEAATTEQQQLKGESSSQVKKVVVKGVISKVHAHVSHCPKLQAPAEVICDIHIRERHGHPNPQLTVGWRRKFYNSTQPDVLLVLNKTQAYDDDDDEPADSPKLKESMIVSGNISSSLGKGDVNATTIIRTGSVDDNVGGADSAKSESLEDFHDKFNVTLAPGISPMLRSVLLIRGVSAPDCGNYQCEVSDGVHTLTSETLLFLCH